MMAFPLRVRHRVQVKEKKTARYMIDESPNTTLFPRVPDPALISTYCVMQQQTSRIVMQNQQHL